MNLEQIINRLNALADHEKVKLKQQKFGINAKNSLGIYHKDLKVLANEIGLNNPLAIALFDTGIYEARILCSKIYDPAAITQQQMNQWASTFETWEVCDSFCMGFFARSPHALLKAFEWSAHKDEFVKRAGFVIMAAYGFANKQAENEEFLQFLPIIERHADDERIYVKKAVNWALRNVGKRNIDLNTQAISTAKRILTMDSKAAKWIANDALNKLAKADVKILNYPRRIYRPVLANP
jgi:3-methyladenine DNA glycosylase AlkD